MMKKIISILLALSMVISLALPAFAGGDEVEFSGIVVYNVVYLDAEGELCSAEFSSDYDYSVKCS